MKHILKVTLLALTLFTACKRDDLTIVNKDFNLEVSAPEAKQSVNLGDQIHIELIIKGFDIENNKEALETYFYVKNEQGESTGSLKDDKGNTITLGKKYLHNYRDNSMTLNLLYTPTVDGDQDLYIEVKCGVITKSISLPIRMQTKNIIVTAREGGVIEHKNNKETSFKLTLKYGEMVRFSAIPNDRFKFVGWYNGTEELSKSINYIFRVERDMRIEARFRPTVYTVIPRINIPEAGSVKTVTGKSTFEDGDLVSVEARPNPEHQKGYLFRGWYVNDQLVGNELTYSFNAKDDVTPEARFERKKFVFKYKSLDSKYLIAINDNSANYQTILYGETYQILLRKVTVGGYSYIFDWDRDNLQIIPPNAIIHVIIPNHKRGLRENQFTFSGICRGDLIIKVGEYRSTYPNPTTIWF